MTIRWIGWSLIGVAPILHPWVLEQFVVLDRHIERWRSVYLLQVVVAATGLAMALSTRARTPSTTSPRRHAFATIALGASTIVALGVVESFLRFHPELALDPETRSELLWRQRQTPGNARSAYAFDSYDPELGWVPTPNYSSDGITTNMQGVRAGHDITSRPPPGTRRIVLIGDSFTWGERTWHTVITNEQTFAARLQHELPAVETVNLGVHGWGTDQQLLYLRRRGLALQPDLVVLGFFELDFERNGVSFFGYAKPWFTLDHGELHLHGTPVPKPEDLLARPFPLPRLLLFSLFGDLIDGALDRTTLHPLERRPAWQVTEALFRAIKTDTERAGAKLLLVDIPPSPSNHSSAVEQATARWASTNHVEYLSLRASFVRLDASESDRLYDGHFTAEGHLVVAREIAAYVQQHHLLDAGGRLYPR